METAVETIPAIARCPACDNEWNDEARCARCGLARADVDALMESACAAAAQARACAAGGRYADALAHIGAARRRGLDRPELDRLEALCRAAVGDWTDLPVDDLPDSWADAVRSGDAAARYAEARTAAAREDWPAALRAVESAAEAAPWLLPARKLQTLALAAAGRAEDAEALRRELLAEAPEEPDLLRYRFAESAPLPETVPAPVRLPRDVVPVRVPERRRGRRFPWVAAGFVVAGFVIGYALAARRAEPRV